MFYRKMKFNRVILDFQFTVALIIALIVTTQITTTVFAACNSNECKLSNTNVTCESNATTNTTTITGNLTCDYKGKSSTREISVTTFTCKNKTSSCENPIIKVKSVNCNDSSIKSLDAKTCEAAKEIVKLQKKIIKYLLRRNQTIDEKCYVIIYNEISSKKSADNDMNNDMRNSMSDESSNESSNSSSNESSDSSSDESEEQSKNKKRDFCINTNDT